ncbi:MAG: hypothetical protein F2934_00175 [Actinobacteria bacterium]|uniref:Unannotated protein n=1 Tax=freshwater metagenome TaxID=449393 RepID=A0A6J6Q2H6_9ZZZZ|nr:hypothetical protein [Actinomycetota bacterium]MSY12340.1 hypothetical protein [Actinomycetota bacterium]MSZ03780.1 hypothetical protein [Actinomycetota bacterium]MTB05529.1 hypothetical protein [Actinomycetota bacterium]
MTEPTTPAPGSNADYPDQHVVEVSSARADGVLTPVEQVEFQTDHRVSALAEQFESLRLLLAQNPEPPRALREQHLAAALDALAPAPVASLEAARIRRAKRLAPALAAAAAIAVLGVVIGSVAGRSSNNEPVAAKNAAEIAAADRTATDQTPQPEPTPVTAEVGPNEAQQLAPTAGVVADSVADNAGTTADTANAGDTEEILTARSTAELRGIALAVVQRGVTNRVPLITNPCSAINGVPVAQVLWMDRRSLLFLVPSAENAVEALVVNPETCDVDASASLTG